jgi:hypothetical protein
MFALLLLLLALVVPFQVELEELIYNTSTSFPQPIEEAHFLDNLYRFYLQWISIPGQVCTHS